MAPADSLKQRSQKLLDELTKLDVAGGDPKATLGWKFFELAAASYEGKHVQFGLRKIAGGGSDEAFGRASPGLLEVSLMGTLGLQHADQWVFEKGNTNVALVEPDSELQGAVHAGFWRGYARLRGQILDWVKPHAAAQTIIRVTGHSRGAAFALLAAADLARRFPGCRVQLVLWAPPRVGDSAFGSSCGELANLSVVAFANKADPVAHLPPEDVGSLPAAVRALLPKEFADSIQGFKHVVEPVVLDAAFAGSVAWEALGLAARGAHPHDIDQYGENYALFFEDVMVACRQKNVQLSRDGFQVVLNLVLGKMPATGRELQKCVAELHAQHQATHRLLQDVGQHIAESLRGLEARIIDELRRAEVQRQGRDLYAAIDALEGALAHVLAAGGDPEHRLRPAIQQVKLQVFGAAQLAKGLADDDHFEAMFKSLASALCMVIYAAVASPLDLPALRGFFAEAEHMHEKFSPLIERQAKRAESASDFHERAPEFGQLARAWELMGRHEDCPPALHPLLPGDVARRLRQKDLLRAMKGWGLRAKGQAARAEELLRQLEDLRKVEAFREATSSWAEHWERMHSARKLLDDARPVLAVGGRANAGKTTFLDEVLRRWVEGAPADILPAHHRENSSCIVELPLKEGAGPGNVLAEVSQKVLNPSSRIFEDDPEFAKTVYSKWEDLRAELAQLAQGRFQEERRQERRLIVTLFNAKRALVLCDTPGMDGMNNMAAITNFARSTIILYVHVAAVDDGSLGSQPFELFKELHRQSCLPPVVVFTKFEKLLRDTEARLREDAGDDGEPDADLKKRAEVEAEEDIARIVDVLSGELPRDGGRRCLPLFAAVSEKPSVKGGGGAGARQLDEVLGFLGSALQEYTELRRADAFVSLVAQETQALIDMLLRSEPGLFSEACLCSFREHLVDSMGRVVDEYFEGMPEDKRQLQAYPSEARKQKAWSRATQRLLVDLEAVQEATQKTWCRKTYIHDVMHALVERWQQAFLEDMTKASHKVLSDFVSASAEDMRKASKLCIPGTSLVELLSTQALLVVCGGGCAVGSAIAITAAHGLRTLGFFAAVYCLCSGLVFVFCFYEGASEYGGLYSSTEAADLALSEVLKALGSRSDGIKEQTKTFLAGLACQAVERLAAFRDPETSELGRAHGLAGCREDAGAVAAASRRLRAEVQEALLSTERWVGGDGRLESIVLRSLERGG